MPCTPDSNLLILQCMQALSRAGLGLDDIAAFEFNEVSSAVIYSHLHHMPGRGSCLKASYPARVQAFSVVGLVNQHLLGLHEDR